MFYIKKPFKLTPFFLLIFYMPGFSQSNADSLYVQKIITIEYKISEIKNLSKDHQQKYHTLLSDVENRKNTLKSLLKTSPANRNKMWEDTWEVNYNKVIAKLYNLKTK